MKAFARFPGVLSLTAFCVACAGGGAGTPAPPAPSANANLGTLTLIPATLEQAFDPNQTTYTALVGFLIDSIHVEVSAEDSAATLTVNGASVDPAGVTLALAEGNNDIAVQVTAANGTTTRTYTVTVTRQSAAVFAQDAYVKASNTDVTDRFGAVVALSGDTLAVGAFLEDSAATGIDGDQSDNNASSAGAVYVFTRDGAGAWSQQAYIKASNTHAGDRFGWSVALSDNTLAISATEEDSTATGIDGDQSDNNADQSGAVYVFQ